MPQGTHGHVFGLWYLVIDYNTKLRKWNHDPHLHKTVARTVSSQSKPCNAMGKIRSLNLKHKWPANCKTYHPDVLINAKEKKKMNSLSCQKDYSNIQQNKGQSLKTYSCKSLPYAIQFTSCGHNMHLLMGVYCYLIIRDCKPIKLLHQSLQWIICHHWVNGLKNKKRISLRTIFKKSSLFMVTSWYILYIPTCTSRLMATCKNI